MGILTIRALLLGVILGPCFFRNSQVPCTVYHIPYTLYDILYALIERKHPNGHIACFLAATRTAAPPQGLGLPGACRRLSSGRAKGSTSIHVCRCTYIHIYVYMYIYICMNGFICMYREVNAMDTRILYGDSNIVVVCTRVLL